MGTFLRHLPLLLLLFCCACQPEPSVSRPFRLNIFSEPPTLDPRRARDVTSETVILMLYEGLTRLDADGVAQLALAESYTRSPDGLVYTFHLRRAHWNNGDPITAHDFISTWDTILDPTFPAERPELLYIIRSARAPDPQTLIVELKRPYEHFPELVAAPTFFPYHDGATNGPFEMVSHRPHHKITAKKSTSYWDNANVHLPGIDVYMVEDESTELNMFRQGELDWAGGPLSCVPFDAIGQLREEGLLSTQPVNKVYWYQFNPEVPPFTNANVRKAFSLAIDRAEIISHITQGTYRYPTGYLPNSAGTPLPHDPEQAQLLLAQGLGELGLDACPTILLSINNGDDHLQIAQAVQQQWGHTLGVHVELRPSDWQVHLDRISRGDYMVARYGRAALLPDSSDILDYLEDRYPLSENTSIDLAEAEQRLLEEMPAAPLFFLSFNHLRNPEVEGVIFTPTAHIDFKSARFTS